MAETVVGKVTASIGMPEAPVSMPAYAPTDPILLGLGWLLAIVVLIIAIGKPISNYLRNEKRTAVDVEVENIKANAEKVLYEHLSQQVTEYRAIADKAFAERNAMFERIGTLEAMAEDLKEAKVSMESMKKRLDEKDEQIKELLKQEHTERQQAQVERDKFLELLAAKDKTLAERDEKIAHLEMKQHDLELRLARDEAQMTTIHCPFSARRRKSDPPATEAELALVQEVVAKGGGIATTPPPTGDCASCS